MGEIWQIIVASLICVAAISWAVWRLSLFFRRRGRCAGCALSETCQIKSLPGKKLNCTSRKKVSR